jgi:hypothetical protein
MSITNSDREKSLGPISPASVPLRALPVVELTNEQLQRVDDLAQERSETYDPIDGGVLFGGQDSLTSHQIGLLGELAVAQFYGLSIDSDIYRLGDDGTDLVLHGSTIDVKATATDAMERPELLVRADKSDKLLNADLYIRAHVINWDSTGARVRIIGAASKATVQNREPQRHPWETKNYVVPPRELSLLPALQSS